MFLIESYQIDNIVDVSNAQIIVNCLPVMECGVAIAADWSGRSHSDRGCSK